MKSRPRSAIALALAALQALALACGALPASVSLGDVARLAVTPATAYGAPTPTPPPANVSTAGLVRRRGRLLVGVRFDAPPLSSVNTRGELEGLDVDLAREFARRWLGGADKVEFSQVTSASAVRRVAAREIDLAMGGIAPTMAGELSVDYSNPYLQDGDALIVRTGVFTSVVGLARKNVVYVDLENTAAMRSAQTAGGFTVTLKSLTSYPAAYEAVRTGAADALVGRLRRLRLEAATSRDLTVLSTLRREPIAIALPQGDGDWASLVNATLNDVVVDGTFESLYVKWFKTRPEGVTSASEATPISLASLPEALTPRNSVPAIARARRIRVGYVTSADPLVFANRDAANGYEADLLRELAKRWFETELAAVFTPYPSVDALAGALQSGAVDAGIGALRITAANGRRFQFTTPDFLGGIGALTLATSKANTFGELNGRTVGVLRDGADPATLAALKQARGVSFNEVVFADSGSALQALRANQIAAVIGDRLQLFAADRVNRDTRILPDQLSALPTGIAVAPGDAALRNALSLGLQEMLVDGALQRIYRKWLDEPFKPPFDPLAGEAPPSKSLITAP